MAQARDAVATLAFGMTLAVDILQAEPRPWEESRATRRGRLPHRAGGGGGGTSGGNTGSVSLLEVPSGTQLRSGGGSVSSLNSSDPGDSTFETSGNLSALPSATRNTLTVESAQAAGSSFGGSNSSVRASGSLSFLSSHEGSTSSVGLSGFDGSVGGAGLGDDRGDDRGRAHASRRRKRRGLLGRLLDGQGPIDAASAGGLGVLHELRVGFIGCGEVGAAIYAALVPRLLRPEQVKISTRTAAAAHLVDVVADGTNVAFDNRRLAASCDVVILCCLPAHLAQVQVRRGGAFINFFFFGGGKGEGVKGNLGLPAPFWYDRILFTSRCLSHFHSPPPSPSFAPCSVVQKDLRSALTEQTLVISVLVGVSERKVARALGIETVWRISGEASVTGGSALAREAGDDSGTEARERRFCALVERMVAADGYSSDRAARYASTLCARATDVFVWLLVWGGDRGCKVSGNAFNHIS